MSDTSQELLYSQLLLKSLIQSPVLVDQLGGYTSMDRSFFEPTNLQQKLNFSQKLGHLYEDALECMLVSSPEVSDLLSSVQIFDASGRTMGECDFLFRLYDKIIHLELAVKFYCSVRIDGELRWYGPDARDHWERKRARMVSHQLPLVKSPEGRELMLKHFDTEEVHTQHLIYGCLFDHIHGDLEHGTDISPAAPRGKWMWRGEMEELKNQGELYHLPKSLWPCGISSELISTLVPMTKGELLQASEQRAVMFTDGVCRYFLVHDDWLFKRG